MKILSQHKNTLVGLFLVSVLAVSLFGVYWLSTLPKPLLASEIQEYQGEDLSKINDFRENSKKNKNNTNQQGEEGHLANVELAISGRDREYRLFLTLYSV